MISRAFQADQPVIITQPPNKRSRKIPYLQGNLPSEAEATATAAAGQSEFKFRIGVNVFRV